MAEYTSGRESWGQTVLTFVAGKRSTCWPLSLRGVFGLLRSLCIQLLNLYSKNLELAFIDVDWQMAVLFSQERNNIEVLCKTFRRLIFDIVAYRSLMRLQTARIVVIIDGIDHLEVPGDIDNLKRVLNTFQGIVQKARTEQFERPLNFKDILIHPTRSTTSSMEPRGLYDRIITLPDDQTERGHWQ